MAFLRPVPVSLCLLPLLFFALPDVVESKKSLDPYKVLGVDKDASQRDIQKAFHKLSLQYHPDKNKNKGAQEKFSEINNAYDILSDEEKRKNYDLYGDEKPGPGFDAGNFGGGGFGGSQGYTFFTGGGPGGSQYSRPEGEGWQGMGGQGNSYSFSFGGDLGGFGFNDLFSSIFGAQSKGSNQYSSFGGNQHGSFGNSGEPKSGSTTSNVRPITYEIYNKEILDRGMTWVLLVYNSLSKDYNMLKSLVEDVSNSLQGAVQAGSINCQNERSLCKELGVWTSKPARIFVYSYRSSDSSSLVEYNDSFNSKSLKNFCIDHLPKFSKRVTLSNFDFHSDVRGNLPQVLLLSTKRETPVMWRAISGLYRKRLILYDAEVNDVTDKNLKKYGVDALPAIVGRLASGESYVLKNGMTVKDLKTGVSDLRNLLDSFEKKSRKVSPQFYKDSQEKVPHLRNTNMDDVCGDSTALCIIGAFRSSKAMKKLEMILSKVSQMSFTRRPNQAQSSSDAVRYGLLDANKQPAFLKSFDEKGFRGSDAVLVAYKPRKGKFAVYTDEVRFEEVENFISSVLSGEIHFSKVRQKPMVK